jgi:hypothetical protein
MSKRLAAAEATIDSFREARRWDDTERALADAEKQFSGQVTSAHPKAETQVAYRFTVKAEIATHRGRIDDARKLFGMALEACPSYVDALVLYALFLVEWGGSETPSTPSSPGAGQRSRRRIPGLKNLTKLVRTLRRRAAARVDSLDTNTLVVDLLTRARSASLEGVEHCSPYRFLLRCKGLLVLCALHEEGERPPVSVSGPVEATPRDLACSLGALSCCDEAWRIAVYYGRARFGIGQGVLTAAVSPVFSDSPSSGSLVYRVSETVTALVSPPAAVRISMAFLSSPEVGYLTDTRPIAMDPAAAGVPQHAALNVWRVGPSTLAPASLAAMGTAAGPPAARSRLADSLILPTDLASPLRQQQQRGTAGPELLLCVDAQSRDVLVRCIARAPVLLHRLGDLDAARRAYVACLDWQGPLAQVRERWSVQRAASCHSGNLDLSPFLLPGMPGKCQGSSSRRAPGAAV